MKKDYNKTIMTRKAVFEKVDLHSFLLSLMLHCVLLLSYLYYDAKRQEEMSNNDLIQKADAQSPRILIDLKTPDEKVAVDTPFVSSVTKDHYGKLKDTQRGLNIMGSFVGDMGHVQQESPFEVKTQSETKPQKSTTALSQQSEFKRKPAEASSSSQRNYLSENTREMKLNINDRVGFSVGAKGEVWAKFYLSYVEAIRESFVKFASNRVLLGSSKVIFETEVRPNGKIILKNFIQRSDRYPALNYVGEKMIEYSTPVMNIPYEMYREVKNNTIPVRVEIDYSSETGYWWLRFD